MQLRMTKPSSIERSLASTRNLWCFQRAAHLCSIPRHLDESPNFVRHMAQNNVNYVSQSQLRS